MVNIVISELTIASTKMKMHGISVVPCLPYTDSTSPFAGLDVHISGVPEEEVQLHPLAVHQLIVDTRRVFYS